MTQKKISQFELTKYILENVNGDNSDLDTREYVVLLCLSGHLNSTTMVCNPSKATIANRCCMSERTVDAAINVLVEKGYIEYEKGGMIGKLRKPNSYTLKLEKIYKCIKKEYVEPPAKENLIDAPPAKILPVVEVKELQEDIPKINPDGSQTFHLGTRCYCHDDYKEAKRKHTEEVNALDQPF